MKQALIRTAVILIIFSGQYFVFRQFSAGMNPRPGKDSVPPEQNAVGCNQPDGNPVIGNTVFYPGSKSQRVQYGSVMNMILFSSESGPAKENELRLMMFANIILSLSLLLSGIAVFVSRRSNAMTL